MLTNGGHNGGVLSEPGHKGRHFRVLDKEEGTRFVGADTWFDRTEPQQGSWWPDWAEWLHARSQGKVVKAAWKPLDEAPGTYVFG